MQGSDEDNAPRIAGLSLRSPGTESRRDHREWRSGGAGARAIQDRDPEARTLTVVRRSSRRLYFFGGVVVVVIALAGVISLGREAAPVPEAGGHEHCFAEWCIALQSATVGEQAVTVGVRVRSDAKQASQRPDHPQAWVIDTAGRQIGGRQRALY